MRTASRKTSFKVAGILLILAITISAGFIARDWAGRQQRLARVATHPESMSASCANHAIRLKLLVLLFIDTNEFFPHEKDARKAFARMRHAAGQQTHAGIRALLPVALPSLAEQQEIVRRVTSLFALADQLGERLSAAQRQVNALTPSLLARAFSGKLVPQDPDDEPASILLERLRHNGSRTS